MKFRIRKIKNDWWKSFFNKDYLRIYRSIDQNYKLISQEVNFIIKSLKIKKTDQILDLCCGQGRHSIEIAKRGYNVTGIDYSKFLLKVANSRSKNLKNRPNFILGDIRSLAKFINNKFDIILNLFTSFGYFSEQENEKVIQGIASVLKPKGKVFIDIINHSWLIRNFKPLMIKKEGNFIIQDKYFLDLKTMRQYAECKIVSKNYQKKYNYNFRIYNFPEMKTILGGSGFKITNIYGSFKGENYNFDSPRLIIITKKL